MIRATLMKDGLDSLQNARLYELSEPVPYNRLLIRNREAIIEGRTTTFIAVSAAYEARPEYADPRRMAVDRSKPHTRIFPTDATGKVLDWEALPGSYDGGCDIDEALRRGGFELQEQERGQSGG